MFCPACESKTHVLETRKYFDKAGSFYYIERRRECKACTHKFVSIEISYETWQSYYVQKEDS